MSKKSEKKISPRRLGRRAAMQFLVSLELSQYQTPWHEIGNILQEDLSKQEKLFWKIHQTTNPKSRKFAQELYKKVLSSFKKIDDIIANACVAYKIHQLGTCERNILRVAIAEMLSSKQNLQKIYINEAIEIAKTFGSQKSGAFVNAILDRVRKEIGLKNSFY